MSNLSPVASVLGVIAQRFGLSGKLLEHRLQRHWPEMVGDQVAMHARPESIRFKKLHVVTDSSVWIQALMFLKPSLLEKINLMAGESLISDIVLRVGEVGAHMKADCAEQSTASPQKGKPSLTQEERAAVTDHAQAVEDPEIRSHLIEVMARALTSSSQRKLPL